MKINRAILPPGRIGLAVSGGSDSVALAFLLTKGGKKKNAAERFVILHVDHGLRPESKEEYRFVRALARRLGVDTGWDRFMLLSARDFASFVRTTADVIREEIPDARISFNLAELSSGWIPALAAA